MICQTVLIENKGPNTARSLCWLRLGDGKCALSDTQQCKAMRPRWPKAWYCEGAALSLLKDYKGAANAFLEPQNSGFPVLNNHISSTLILLSEYHNKL
ncbi:hypothetical protein BDA96_09G159400 [Sorghum bicolor]|uniref:Uncharacterized protein n=2 Tax=Sorghum bicolor TaxID=4558 RepID=A0A921Q9Z8_SORBI|nr:hypothetical protein BDA96_09G159400 [Sorghum bicolor]